MRTAGLERTAQRRAGAEQMRLPDELIERLWTQPVRQRPVSAVAHRVHCGSRPITSTPGGGEKENKSGANLALRVGCVKVSWVT